MSERNELISVIVPIYNAGRYLNECIQSILAQTYLSFELILVDDGSIDNSLEICRLYQKQDARISVIHQENAGVSVARNVGLSVMKGQYFCFVDSDDSIEPEMIEKLYYAIRANDAELAICGFKNVSKTGVSEFRPITEDVVGKEHIAEFVLEHYLEWLVSSPCGKLYKDIQYPARKFDPSISLGEDLKFNVQFVEHIEKIIVIEDCLYRYMDVEDSLTKTYKKGYYEAICDIYESTVQYVKRVLGRTDGSNFSKVNYKLFSFCISFMSQNLMSSNIEDEKAFIMEICESKQLQQAIHTLPPISIVRKIYVWGIKKKKIRLLCLLSYFKYKIIDKRNNRERKNVRKLY